LRLARLREATELLDQELVKAPLHRSTGEWHDHASWAWFHNPQPRRSGTEQHDFAHEQPPPIQRHRTACSSQVRRRTGSMTEAGAILAQASVP